MAVVLDERHRSAYSHSGHRQIGWLGFLQFSECLYILLCDDGDWFTLKEDHLDLTHSRERPQETVLRPLSACTSASLTVGSVRN